MASIVSCANYCIYFSQIMAVNDKTKRSRKIIAQSKSLTFQAATLPVLNCAEKLKLELNCIPFRPFRWLLLRSRKILRIFPVLELGAVKRKAQNFIRVGRPAAHLRTRPHRSRKVRHQCRQLHAEVLRKFLAQKPCVSRSA